MKDTKTVIWNVLKDSLVIFRHKLVPQSTQYHPKLSHFTLSLRMGFEHEQDYFAPDEFHGRTVIFTNVNTGTALDLYCGK